MDSFFGSPNAEFGILIHLFLQKKGERVACDGSICLLKLNIEEMFPNKKNV